MQRGRWDKLISTVLPATTVDCRPGQPSSGATGTWTGCHLGAKGFPAVACFLCKQSEGRGLSRAEETQRGAAGRCLGERDWLWGGHFDLRAGKKAEAEGLAAQATACGQSPEIAVWVELCRDSGTTGLVRHVSRIARDLSAQAV